MSLPLQLHAVRACKRSYASDASSAQLCNACRQGCIRRAVVSAPRLPHAPFPLPPSELGTDRHHLDVPGTNLDHIKMWARQGVKTPRYRGTLERRPRHSMLSKSPPYSSSSSRPRNVYLTNDSVRVSPSRTTQTPDLGMYIQRKRVQ